jgi:hypothetical protein
MLASRDYADLPGTRPQSQVENVGLSSGTSEDANCYVYSVDLYSI